MVPVVIMAGSLLGLAQSAASPEQRTSRYFERIRREPALLLLFLRQLPKGGDLHNHLSGAVYAESYIAYAAAEGLCVDRRTSTLLAPPCDETAGRPPVTQAFREPALYGQMVDAFSIRNFPPGASGLAQHFFDAFLKFDAATRNHRGEMLAEVVSRAAEEKVTYLELIQALDQGEASALGARLGWEPDLGRMRQRLLDGGIRAQVESARKRLDTAEARMREIQRCGTAEAEAGCGVLVRHIAEVHRAFPPEQVFAELVFGFELAQSDPRVISVNLVMAEADYVSRRDFDLHMRMIDYLHGLYPEVAITLHAGELVPGLAPPEDLRSHIRKSIERGHARRIGHGTAVLYENDAPGLLREMARRQVLVEFCPTSYALLLSAPGVPHPLPAYLQYGVPVALATDDMGVARSDTTMEYMRAIQTFGLKYTDLKRMARHSLEYAFLSGESLWADAARFRRATPCAGDRAEEAQVSAICRQLLERSQRARLQWDLERAFARLESQY
jgi:hypothetical protein